MPLAAAVTSLVTAVPARAQSGCSGSGSGIGSVNVQVTDPAAGATVSGDVVVRGSASAVVVGQLNHVDVSLGNASRGEDIDPGQSVSFEVHLDASKVNPGSANLVVVVCGLLARGEKRMVVTVAPPAATTSTTPGSTTSVPGSPGTTVSPSTTAVGSGTTVAGSSGGSAGGPASTVVVSGATKGSTVAPSATTTVAGSPTTVGSSPGPTTAKADPVRPKTTSPGGQVLLTDSPPKHGSGPPLWVGAVVGLSGGLGLLYSAAWRRRGSGRGPRTAQPIEDPDLVDVR